MDLEKIRNSAAAVLAASVNQSYPGVTPIEGGNLTWGFYYDFIFPHSINPELLSLIEEKMRQMVREDLEIRSLEMVAMSAREFLKAKGFKQKSSQVEGDGLFSVIQIGDFVDLMTGPFLESTGELSAFKLSEIQQLGDGQIRIVGFADQSKDVLKDFIKKHAKYEKISHKKIGSLEHCFEFFDNQIVFLPNGIKRKNEFISCLTSSLGNLFFSVETDPNAEDKLPIFSQILKRTPEFGVYEEVAFCRLDETVEDLGLFDPEFGKKILIGCSYNLAKSLLQSIDKTLNILGFSYDLCLTASKKGQKQTKVLDGVLKELSKPYAKATTDQAYSYLDFLVSDGLGRSWSFARIYAKTWVMAEVIVERNLALLLEKNSS